MKDYTVEVWVRASRRPLQDTISEAFVKIVNTLADICTVRSLRESSSSAYETKPLGTISSDGVPELLVQNIKRQVEDAVWPLFDSYAAVSVYLFPIDPGISLDNRDSDYDRYLEMTGRSF